MTSHPMTLYYSSGTCSFVPHAVLEELGVPYEAVAVPIREKAHLTPEYTAINPLQRVPALTIGPDQHLTEVAAIIHHLADTHADAGLLPPIGDPARARAYEWSSFLGTTVHMAYGHFRRAHRFSTDRDHVPAIKAAGRAHVEWAYDGVERRLGGRPWALGERYSVCDPYAFICYLWGMRSGLPMAERWPAYTAHYRRVRERPAIRRTLDAEGIRLPD